MNREDQLTRLRSLTREFSSALEQAVAGGRLGTTVPTCPDWAVRDLVSHVGGIYRWVTRLVDEGIVVETWRTDMDITYPVGDTDVSGWFDAGVEPLVVALEAAPPERRVFVWGADPHARFWLRRMLHETAVHLHDLSLTLHDPPTTPASPGNSTGIDTATAVDGIDEFLTNLPCTARWGAPLDELRGNGETMLIRPTDTHEAWRLRFEPSGCWWDRSGSTADLTVSGPVNGLYLFLQGRANDAVRFDGRVELFEARKAALAF